MRKNYILAAFIFFILGFASAYYFFWNSSSEQLISEPQKVFIKDTLLKIIPSKPVVITKVRAKVTKVSDTIIKTVPFIAEMDTIIQQDTINAKYEFPRNTFSLELRKKADSIMLRTITITNTVEKEREWWELPAAVIGGVVGGYILGKK